MKQGNEERREGRYEGRKKVEEGRNRYEGRKEDEKGRK